MKSTVLDVIIVGAGPAGLNASYWLKKKGISHKVFERGTIGESWRSQRWHTFRLNSSNRLNALPELSYFKDDTEGFCSSAEFVASLEDYVASFQLPVSENTPVHAVEKPEGSGLFKVVVLQKGHQCTHYARQVIVASGAQNEVRIPAFAKYIAPEITQLHASEYRHAGQLPDGNVLVTGSAQSGCQIAEDLLDAGRKVFLSTGMIARTPRRYRGQDIMDWLLEMKFFDVRPEEIKDPKMLLMKAPQLTGVDGGKRTISLQALAKRGATILGRMENAERHLLFFQPNAAEHVKFADDFSKKVKEMIDDFIAKNHLPHLPQEVDEADVADKYASCASSITSLHVLDHSITSIIWATGFHNNLSYIKLPVLDAEGNLKHKEGVSDIAGLYFLGFPWLRNRKSILLCGIKDDAAFIAEKVYSYSLTLKEVV